MPFLVEDLPYDPASLQLQFPFGQAQRRNRQIILWASITKFPGPAPDQRCLFPIVFDTGFNHSFLIQESHLRQWSQQDPAQLTQTGWLLLPGISPQVQRVPLRDAYVWIHPNTSGDVHPMANGTPLRLDLPDEMAITPTNRLAGYLRLPLLGMRVLRANHLRVTIDGSKDSVTIEQP